MHWTEVDGLLLPNRIGGHPALDFCNTWAGWGEPPAPRREWLKTYDQLAAWSEYAGLLPTGDSARLRRLGVHDDGAAGQVLGDTRRLRTALHTAVLDPTDRRAMAVVTGFARAAAATIRLRPGVKPAWEIAVTAGVRQPLLAIAWSAGELLTSGRLDQVSACPGDDCGWLFLDSRGRRRWCSMSSCGNRAKVRAHAARQRND